MFTNLSLSLVMLSPPPVICLLASLGAVFWFFSIANKRVNLCTVVIIAPSRFSVNVPLRKFEVVLVSPFTVIRLHEKQYIDEPIPHIPEAAPVAVKIRLAAYG